MALDYHDIKTAMVRFDELITTYRGALNGLNVYPVPDGDTGSNMAGTVKRVMAELDGTESMADVADAISHGSLMGAKGNSGIILSVILSGLADAFSKHDSVDVAEFTHGLVNASASAYHAVATPVEGTILSVIRESSEEAETIAASDMSSLLDAVFRRSVDALARTPEALPILKQAGVVDAGGAGLVLLLAAFAETAEVESLELPQHLLTAVAHLENIDMSAVPAVSELRYEVMFFLDATEQGMTRFRTEWDELGDSIAISGSKGKWNCHIHTDHIGPAIEAAISVGTPSNIRVTDLTEDAGVHSGDDLFLPRDEAAIAPIGVVAVVNGPGLVAVFRDLGVQAVVRGGQSMNPSTEELLSAVESVPAKHVILLPNNKNIVPVAEQIDNLSAKTVRVVPSRSVPQGITAMLGYTTASDDVEETAETMAAAASSVMVGEVTVAVRDARVGDLVISAGDWIGLADGAIVVNGSDVESVLRGLVAELMPPAHPEIVTLYTGLDASLPATKSLEAYLGELHPEVDLVVVAGGQPTYPYLISVE